MVGSKTECVQVVVRCRPENDKERNERRGRVVTVDQDTNSVAVRAFRCQDGTHSLTTPQVVHPEAQHEPPKTFTYDKVTLLNTRHWLHTLLPHNRRLTRKAGSSTCTTKLHAPWSKQSSMGTMAPFLPMARPAVAKPSPCWARTAHQNCVASSQTPLRTCFQRLSRARCLLVFFFMRACVTTYQIDGCSAAPLQHRHRSGQGKEFLVRASYLEIYNEDIRDLLARGSPSDSRLELKEHPDKGVYVRDLTQCVVKTVDECLELLMVRCCQI